MDSEARLISIPPSHYCEKARWALTKKDIPYIEDGHPPIFHRRAVKKAGGLSSTPVLVTGDGVYPDSTDILRYLQQKPGGGWRPYPEDPELRRKCEELEEHFDTKLGPHTRRLAYYYLLQYRDLFLRSVLAGVGRGERTAFTILSPVVTILMRKGMNITETSAERSLGYIRTIFAGVDELLADGRRFLIGDEFTAADLTFACMAAPAVLPPQFGSPLPTLEEVPAEMLELIEEFRATTAGAFVLRLYEDHR